MRNRLHVGDPFLLELRAAVQATMQERGHTQIQVSTKTGMPQSQISRFLGGEGKRMTQHLHSLCVYADLYPNPHESPSGADEELSQLLREVIGDNARAAQAMLEVVKALAPALRHMPYRRAKERRAS
mgnify:CR=1 FL=1